MIRTLTNLLLENERLMQVILFGQLELIPLLKARRELMSRVAQGVYYAIPHVITHVESHVTFRPGMKFKGSVFVCAMS